MGSPGWGLLQVVVGHPGDSHIQSALAAMLPETPLLMTAREAVWLGLLFRLGVLQVTLDAVWEGGGLRGAGRAARGRGGHKGHSSRSGLVVAARAEFVCLQRFVRMVKSSLR